MIDYYKDLCFIARYSGFVADQNPQGKITRIKNNMLQILCRCIKQEGVNIPVPVSREEIPIKNDKLRFYFNLAYDNTPRFFPAIVYDLKRNNYFDVGIFDEGEYDFQNSSDISIAAEETTNYAKDKDYGLRFIVRYSPEVGYAPLFYPQFMGRIGKKLREDPEIVIIKPGELLIFEGGLPMTRINNYLKSKYGYKGEKRAEILTYIYRRHQQTLQDNSTSIHLASKGNKIAKIPPGSVSSAWGNTKSRREMYIWRNSKEEQ